MTNTKRNHFIPQKYLSKWANANGQIYCLEKSKNKIFNTSSVNLCNDRLWNNSIEKYFSHIEREEWFPVIDNIIKNNHINISEQELNKFLSFSLALISRNKRLIANCRTDYNDIVSKYNNELVNNEKEDFFNITFPASFSADHLFNQTERGKYSILNKFNFSTKKIESNEYYFITSDRPCILDRNSDNYVFFSIALTPTLLVFGARDIRFFKHFQNMKIEESVERFNKAIYNQSKFIFSNKKELIEKIKK